MFRPFRGRRQPNSATAPLTGVLALTLLSAAACSNQKTETASSTAGTPTAEPAWVPVEERYVIGPDTARGMGYRVDWQSPATGARITKFVVDGGSVFALDDENVLTRIRNGDGNRLWRLPVGRPLDQVLGITYVPKLDRVLLTTGASLLVLDADTGSLVDRQRLERIASTGPVSIGPYLVYGSRDGQLVWHAYEFGTPWRGYDIAQAITVPPVTDGEYVVGVGLDGEIMSLDGRSASQIWNRRALDRVVATPAIGNGVVYIPSLDQHLRAFEVARARTPIWEYLSESPLTDAPVLIGDRVYQQSASEGLVCLEAAPLDNPGGVVVWQSPETSGSVLTRHRGRLIVWEADTKRLVMLDERLGSVIDTIDVPQVDQIWSSAVDDGDLYATSLDGRLVRVMSR